MTGTVPEVSFTCPRCGRTSYHPRDMAEGYCGACHAWTGFTDVCQVCGASEIWSSSHAAGCAMTWHVYETHPEVRAAMSGGTAPKDPRPVDTAVVQLGTHTDRGRLN